MGAMRYGIYDNATAERKSLYTIYHRSRMKGERAATVAVFTDPRTADEFFWRYSASHPRARAFMVTTSTPLDPLREEWLERFSIPETETKAPEHVYPDQGCGGIHCGSSRCRCT